MEILCDFLSRYGVVIPSVRLFNREIDKFIVNINKYCEKIKYKDYAKVHIIREKDNHFQLETKIDKEYFRGTKINGKLDTWEEETHWIVDWPKEFPILREKSIVYVKVESSKYYKEFKCSDGEILYKFRNIVVSEVLEC